MLKIKIIFGLLITSLVLIGCGEDDKKEEKKEEEKTEFSMMLTKRSVSHLVDNAGMSLYVFDNDELNKSNCSGGCSTAWPAFTSDETKGAEFTEIDEASKQIAFNQHPLYYFSSDKVAGDVNGDGVGGVWHLLFPASDFVDSDLAKLSTAKMEKNYLVDGKGMALYTFDEDEEDKSNCTGQCLAIWPIFNGEITEDMLGEGLDASMFAVITHENGEKQVTFNKKPLYYYAVDKEVGDFKGDWVHGTWHSVEIK